MKSSAALSVCAAVWLTAVGCGYIDTSTPPPPLVGPGLPGESRAVLTTARPNLRVALDDFLVRQPEPVQPIEFPHNIHVGKQIACTEYCHESVTTGPVAGLPSVRTCMICHNSIATDRPRIKLITEMRDQGHRSRLAARLRLSGAVAREVQPRAAHPERDRVRDLPRPDRPADRGAEDGGSEHGLLRELPPGEAGAARLPDLPLLMDRRSFIKLTAVSGTTAALASCGSPENTLVRFVPDEDIVPGQATWKPGVCPMCASGCGLTVRVMDADRDVVRNGQAGLVRIYAAKKLEGSPEHPVNHGGLCTRGQAAIQVTYHPDRITQPLKRSGNRGDAKYQAVSWDDAIAELVGRLDMLAAGGSQRALAFLGRARTGHRALVVQQFLARFGAPAPLTWELFDDEVVRRANAVSFGRAQMPTFDLANARFVLSFGADFLGTWNSPVSQSHAYGAMRQGRRGIRGAFVQVEARMSQTGANADQWVPVRPGHRRRAGAGAGARPDGGEGSDAGRRGPRRRLD